MASSQHMARRAITGAALAGLTVLIAACGSAAPSASSGTGTPGTGTTTGASSATTASSPASTGASTPATGSTSGSGQDTAAGGAPACLSRYLRAAPGNPQGTAGSVYVPIVFTNLDNQPCTLYGYPGVSLAAGKPVQQVGLAATENASPPRELVTLKPGGTANALLRIVDAGNYSAGQCGPVTTTWLQVFPPNQKGALYVSYSSTACSKPVHLLSVNVVQPGSGSAS